MSDQIRPRPRTVDEIRHDIDQTQQELGYYQDVASEWVLSQPPEPLIVLPGFGLKIMTLPPLPVELQGALVEAFERLMTLEAELYQFHRGRW